MGGARLITLDVVTFCCSVFGGHQGPISWWFQVLLDNSPRWSKFNAANITRPLFVSGALGGMLLVQSPSRWALSCNDASYVMDGPSAQPTVDNSGSSSGRRRMRRAADHDKPMPVDFVDVMLVTILSFVGLIPLQTTYRLTFFLFSVIRSCFRHPRCCRIDPLGLESFCR